MHMQMNLGFVQASGSLMSFRLKQAKCSSYLPQLVCLCRCLPKHVWLLEGGQYCVLAWRCLVSFLRTTQQVRNLFLQILSLHEDKEKARATLPTTPCQFLEGSDTLSCVGTERCHCGHLLQVGPSAPALLSHAARPACKLAEGEGSLATFSALGPTAANCVHYPNFLPYVLSLLLLLLSPSFVLSTNTETYFC